TDTRTPPPAPSGKALGLVPLVLSETRLLVTVKLAEPLPWVSTPAQMPPPSAAAELSSTGMRFRVTAARPEAVLVIKALMPPPSKGQARFPVTEPGSNTNEVPGPIVREAVPEPELVTLASRPPPPLPVATLEERKSLLVGANVAVADPAPVVVSMMAM